MLNPPWLGLRVRGVKSYPKTPPFSDVTSLLLFGENGLPGRYCPETAGRLLLEAALKAMRKGGKEDV